MKRKLIVKVLLCLLMVASIGMFFGCHGAKVTNEFVIPEEFDLTKEYNITFWAKNDSNKVQKQIYTDTVRRFEEYYPNIHVTIQNYSDYVKIYNDVINNLVTKTTPNVCITYPDYVATFIEGENVVVPLDNLINNEKFGFGGSEVKFDSVKEDELIDKFMDELVINDKQYALPFVRSSEATYVNKNLVNELGFELPDVLTWDFVWEVCAKAREVYPLSEYKTFIPLIYKSTDNMMIQMTKQKEIEFTKENGEVLLFNDKTKELLKELAEYGRLGYYDTFKRVSYPGNFFNAGNCIFAIDSTAGATWMGSSAPLMDIPEEDVKEFETVVYPVPQENKDKKAMISQGPSICIFNKEDSGEVLASWLFAQFLLNDETQIAYAKTEGYVPVTKSAMESDAYKSYLASGDEKSDEFYSVKIDASKVVIDNINNTFITPVFSGSSLVRTAAGELIETSLQDVKSKKYNDSDEYYNKLFENIKALYKINNIVVK